MVAHAFRAERLQDLLAGEAAGDLELSEVHELDALLARCPGVERYELLPAAGMVQLAFLRTDPRGVARMPSALETRLMKQAENWQPRQSRATGVTDLAAVRKQSGGRTRTRSWLSGSSAGWYLAAGLAIAALVVQTNDPGPVASISAAEQRAQLLRVATDVVTASWSRSTEPGFENVTGDVVWSNMGQEGYLRLAGLPVNDPTRVQYQLWIVDPRRDSHPVDGGVFDVAASGEVIVPIHAKLAVGRPTAFAITLEQPGGVVVSDGPLLVVAGTGG